MSFTPEDYAYICDVLLTYGLQHPLQVRIEDAQADVDLALVTRDYTTLMDVVSEPPSPRPTGVPSPQIPEPFLHPGANEDLAASLIFSPAASEIYGVVVDVPIPDDVQIHQVDPSPEIPSSPLLLSQPQVQPRPHDASPTTGGSPGNTVIQIDAASPDDHYVHDPPSGENTPKDYCRWRGNCGRLINTDRRSVSEHLRSAHHLDLRKKAPPIVCLWPGCQSGLMNADSLARHISSAIGHLSGAIHGCEHCLQRGYFRRDVLDRHSKDCPLNPQSGNNFLNSSMLCHETDLGGGLIMCVFEETANREKAVASHVKYAVAEWAADSFLCTVLPTRCYTTFS